MTNDHADKSHLRPPPQVSAWVAGSVFTIPRIGEHWSTHGGIFAGIVAADPDADGQPDTLLILGPEAPHELTWQQAMAWAAKLDTHGHTDWSLPNRREQAVLYGNLKKQFKADWYWSSTQYAGYEAYAWCQTFNVGGQSYDRKDYEFRARAVRRVAI